MVGQNFGPHLSGTFSDVLLFIDLVEQIGFAPSTNLFSVNVGWRYREESSGVLGVHSLEGSDYVDKLPDPVRDTKNCNGNQRDAKSIVQLRCCSC